VHSCAVLCFLRHSLMLTVQLFVILTVCQLVLLGKLCALYMPVCRSLVGLELFPHLEEVILDSNDMTDSSLDSLPQLHRVHSLSLNKNKISFNVLIDHMCGSGVRYVGVGSVSEVRLSTYVE